MFRLRTIDWSFVAVPLVLAIVSIATIYTITYDSIGNKLALSQFIYAVIGFGLLTVFSIIDYRQYRAVAFGLLGVGIILLIPTLPFLSGKLPFVICEFNSCRWLNLGFFRLQTSELFKLITILVMAAVLCDRVGKLPWWYVFVFLGGLAVPVFLIMEQPDLGTSLVVLFTGGALLLLARFPWWVWGGFMVLALIAAPMAWQNLKPYQQRRVEVFLNPELDVSGTGYNVRQAEIAVGNGGVFGRGFGQGSQSQLNFLPVAHTDFIFSGFAEATGFVGAVFLVVVYAFLVWRALKVAEIAKDNYGRFVAIGIAAMLGVQVFINIGMNIRLMPVTGVPLPIVSYGGTSLFITMMALGILQSIVIRHKKINFA